MGESAETADATPLGEAGGWGEASGFDLLAAARIPFGLRPCRAVPAHSIFDFAQDDGKGAELEVGSRGVDLFKGLKMRWLCDCEERLGGGGR